MKILGNGRFEIDGVKFTPSCYPPPQVGNTGDVVDLGALPASISKPFTDGFEIEKDLIDMRSKSADQKAAKQKTIQSAKWTVLTGHRRRCGGREEHSIFFCTLSKGAGLVINVLKGGHDIEEKGSGRRVTHCSSLEELIEAFSGKLVGRKVYARNPALVIGRGGATIKFLGQVAGMRLEVISL